MKVVNRRRAELEKDQENGGGSIHRVSSTSAESESEGSNGLLLGCALGLQLAYVSWGLLQEQLMTKGYSNGGITATPEKFPSVTFLVFSNRLFAMLTALAMLLAHQAKEKAESDVEAELGAGESDSEAQAPRRAASAGFGLSLNKCAEVFGPASLSNVLSSWCQYSALAYVSFPTQVLFKSNKIIPTMLMGRFLKGKRHPWRDYAEALIISLSVATFMLYEKKRKPKPGEDEDDAESMERTAYGVIMLCAYLMFDSFTSQWQSVGFARHKLSQHAMMLGINAVSLGYTLVRIAPSGEFQASMAFLQAHPEARQHVFLFSLCGCVGQLFIFFTIKRFGPVLFSVIMTTRQMLSMVASCIIFGHPLGAVSLLAAMVVFGVLGLRIQRRFTK